MTENKRLSVAITPEIEEMIYELRKKDEFCRKSVSEIVRVLIMKGLEDDASEKSA